jgi:hypothetical protein
MDRCFIIRKAAFVNQAPSSNLVRFYRYSIEGLAHLRTVTQNCLLDFVALLSKRFTPNDKSCQELSGGVFRNKIRRPNSP